MFLNDAGGLHLLPDLVIAVRIALDVLRMGVHDDEVLHRRRQRPEQPEVRSNAVLVLRAVDEDHVAPGLVPMLCDELFDRLLRMWAIVDEESVGKFCDRKENQSTFSSTEYPITSLKIAQFIARFSVHSLRSLDFRLGSTKFDVNNVGIK